VKDSEIRLHLHYLLRGSAGVLFIVTLWILTGRMAESMELGFLRIRILPETNSMGKSSRDAVVTVSRSCAAIRFSDQRQDLLTGEEVSQTFLLSSPVPSMAHRLEFFVTGDQRARAIPLLVTDFVLWKDLPIEYSVTVNGKVVSNGPIEQLSRPFFLEIPAVFFARQNGFSSDSVQVCLTLKCTQSCALPSIAPALAFEYPFYGNPDSERASGNVPLEDESLIRVYNHALIKSH